MKNIISMMNRIRNMEEQQYQQFIRKLSQLKQAVKMNPEILQGMLYDGEITLIPGNYHGCFGCEFWDKYHFPFEETKELCCKHECYDNRICELKDEATIISKALGSEIADTDDFINKIMTGSYLPQSEEEYSA